LKKVKEPFQIASASIVAKKLSFSEANRVMDRAEEAFSAPGAERVYQAINSMSIAYYKSKNDNTFERLNGFETTIRVNITW